MDPIKVKTLHLFSLHLFDQHGRCGYSFAACSPNIPSSCLKNTLICRRYMVIMIRLLSLSWMFDMFPSMWFWWSKEAKTRSYWQRAEIHGYHIIGNCLDKSWQIYTRKVGLPCGFVSWFIVIAAAGNNAKKEEFEVIKGPPRIEKHMISSNIFQICFAFAYSKPSTLLPFNFAATANNMWSYCIPFSLSTVCTCSY